MEILRTPDEFFRELPGYPFAPRYVPVDPDHDLRVHYVDEGVRDGWPILMLHGEPSWSYLYRHMIPIFVEAGYRAIAPDLIGFGRSDKPAARADYTYQRHVDWMERFLLALDLREVTLVCQDWGGLIGLRLVAAHPERFARVIAANTFLPTGEEAIPEAFHAWRKLSQDAPRFLSSRVIQMGTRRELSEPVLDAYDAPFPDESYLAGAREFPMLVPTSPDDPASEPNRRAWEALRRFERPFLTAFSDGDPITRGADLLLREAIPGAAGRDHVTLAGAGHFLQEDRGPELAQVVLAFAAQTTPG
jgi:haloalkane dehalogenase